MNREERVARALCMFEGRNPDHCNVNEPQWYRYRSQASAVLWALDVPAQDLKTGVYVESR